MADWASIGMWDKLLAAGLVLMTGSVAWFWRFVMGHDRRLSQLETNLAITNAHLENIEKNIERGVVAIEKMDDRHRNDIVRAYEKVEAVHLVVIEHLTKD